MRKWWEEPKSTPAEVEYVPIYKMIPLVSYETIIEHEFIYEPVFVHLPPEIIYETIIEYQTIYETIIEYVPEYVYEIITKTEYETIYVSIPVIVPGEPTIEEIIKYIKENSDDPVIKKIIKEIISKIPPEEIMTYLTDEQIKYIINKQPPQIILQTITIIDIEYIIFSGDTSEYNGNSPKTGGTNLSPQEKSTNDTIINAMAKALVDNPEYLMILHGHANPTTTSQDEIDVLKKLSEDRAKAVGTVLKAKFSQFGGNTAGWDTRVSSNGYGGEKNLSVTNSTYSGLNRRVEMILVKVGV
jgi:hypothetical protein